MTSTTQTYIGIAVAAMFALVATIGMTSSNPIFANFAAADYGGSDDVTICHVSKGDTLVVPAVEVQSHLDHGDTLGPCSTDAGTLVIGKAYLAGGGTQDWIELYNPSNQTVSLSGWEICNAFSCDSLSGSVAPGAYALLAGQDSIHTEISIPWGVELVMIGDGQIGSGLSASGDIIKLRGSDSIIVDQMNWGTTDMNWPNYNANAWATGSLTATAGQALARTPVTNDTNAASDFVSLGIPTVSLGTPNVTLGATTEITWSTTNPNGSEGALTIDLYWFEDDDTLHLIELDTPNDGSYLWEVPADIVGGVRIKVVATGPENPLLNDRDLVGPIAPTTEVEMKKQVKEVVEESEAN